METPHYELLGDSAIQVLFGRLVDDALLARVHRFARELAALQLPCISDIVPAYASVTVHYNVLQLPVEGDVPPMAVLQAALTEANARAGLSYDDQSPLSDQVIDLPVCYGGEYGPDLAWLAEQKQLTADDLIALHCAVHYRVAMIGFAPGFCYLAGLDSRLHTPRRAQPRTQVPAGSVAIGGNQTGVYPADLPGGWHLIGRTPLSMFDPTCAPYARVQPGDRVRFVPLPHNEWPAR